MFLAHKKFQAEKKISASDILEYVCWLADPDKMYEFALGTCDLDLVAMVAVQTQKVYSFLDFFFFFLICIFLGP